MKKNKIFYGWFIILGAFLLIFLDGLLLYSFGVLLPSIETKYGLSNASVASIFSVRCLVFAFSMILFGKLTDKYKPQKVIFFGGLLSALGIFLTAFSTSKIALFFNYGVLTGLGDGAFYVPAIVIAQRWFNKRRDFAVGLATTGVPISGLVVNPLSAYILKETNLETTLIVLSIITLLFLFGAFLMKESPEEMNLEPYGGKFPKEEDDIENSWSSSSAIKTLSFNILYLQLVLGMLSFLIVVTFQYDLALERGFNILTSSLAPASIAAGSFFGRLVAGFLSDYVDRNKILFSVFLGQALSVFIILNSSTIYGFILFGITFGFCYAGWIPIFPSKLKDFYGKANSGVIYGIFGTGFSISAIFGPPLGGYLIDKFGTYEYGLYFCIVVCLIAAFLSLVIKKPTKI